MDDATLTKISLTSDAFEDGQPIPQQHTCDGADQSPALHWGEVPEGTRSFALIVDDPDAPRGTFTHWLAWGIDPAAGGLREGEAAPVEGSNDLGQTNYRGPARPPVTARTGTSSGCTRSRTTRRSSLARARPNSNGRFPPAQSQSRS